MRILLDTQILVWLLTEPGRLKDNVQQELRANENDVLFSAASIWEIAIKAAARSSFNVSAQVLLDEAVKVGFVELPVRAATTVWVSNLPLHHRDPFDRLLVAQAISEPAVLYTADSKLQQYSELVRLV